MRLREGVAYDGAGRAERVERALRTGLPLEPERPSRAAASTAADHPSSFPKTRAQSPCERSRSPRRPGTLATALLEAIGMPVVELELTGVRA